MRDSALYFPYIEVPDHPSLTRVMLYWDRLGSIVPRVELSERMRELIAAELVERVEPGAYLRHGFDTGFLRILEAMPSETRGAGALTQSIHIEKGTNDLWEELRQRGLAEEGGHPWMHVTESVAAAFMAYLAGYLGRNERLGMEPITDRPGYFAPYLASDPRQALTQQLDSARAVVLRNVLPAPAEPVAVAELADFKHANWDLLRSFRVEVEGRLLDCARERDPDLRERCLDQHAAELEDQVVQIEERMGQLGRPTGRALLCAALPAIYAAAKFAATGDSVDSGYVAIPLITEVLRSTEPPSEATDDSPLAYAALARREFGGAG